MSNFKQMVLRKLASDLGEGSDKLFDAIDRPGRATRAGISALQQDKPVFEAIKRQFGANPPEAPSGADIAERFGQDYDIQNPAVLGSVATAADFFDPTMLIPGAQVGKLGAIARMAKGAKKGENIAEAVKRGQDIRKTRNIGLDDLSPTKQQQIELEKLNEMARTSGMNKIQKAGQNIQVEPSVSAEKREQLRKLIKNLNKQR